MKHIVPLILCLLCFTARADDEDKANLFNTFYLDGDAPSYVLVLRQDRSFDLYGPAPGEEHISGNFRADEQHVTLLWGDFKRYFDYDLKGKDLRLSARENDVPVKGTLIGELPPLKSPRMLYVAQVNWTTRGRQAVDLNVRKAATDPPPIAFEPRGKAPRVAQVKAAPIDPERAAASVRPAQPAPPVMTLATTSKEVAGTYLYRANPFIVETLILGEDGGFSYTGSNGSSARGTFKIEDAVMRLSSDDEMRQFTPMLAGGKLLLIRVSGDAPKNKNDLAAMSPSFAKSALYESKK